MVNDGVFVALGSNLGDRAGHLAGAVIKLNAASGVRVLRCSSQHETDAEGGPAGQGKYLNAVAELSSEMSPQGLLDLLLRIEREHGRVRREPNAARTLDLDLLLYGNVRVDEPGLILPHPRMWSRAFVLAPLRELIGGDRVEALHRWSEVETVGGRTAAVR